MVVLSLLALNLLTTFSSIWIPPYVELNYQIGPDFLVLWTILLLSVAIWGQIGRTAQSLLSGLFLFLIISRAFAVISRAWFGRDLNLYWDAQHLPTFLNVVSQKFPWWQTLGAVITVVFFIWLSYKLVRGGVFILAQYAAPFAIRKPIVIIMTVILLSLPIANTMKVEALSPYVSSSIFPEYLRQANLLSSAFFPSIFPTKIPPTPSLASDLQALNGAEVKVLFLESYGATTYKNKTVAKVMNPARKSFEEAANAQGRQVLSAYVQAATFGGASDLSHLSFLSALDLSNPIRHDLLLNTNRPTILDTFEQAGYRTIGLYPAMSWEWPEVSFYSFDHYQDAQSLNYRGPKFGYWSLTDQFSMARIDQMFPADPNDKPRFLFYPTINTHLPFKQTPPHQPDWSRLTTEQPYSEEATAKVLNDTEWKGMTEGYILSFKYTFEWLTSYQALPQARESFLIMLGDHQPAGGIVGKNGTWDVPVHIVTQNNLIAKRLRDIGFQDGMVGPLPHIGHISELPLKLLSVFDSKGPNAKMKTTVVEKYTSVSDNTITMNRQQHEQ